MALGALFLVLWQGRARLVGLAPMVLAFALWSQTTRPDVLIAESGALIGVMTPEGRALNKEKGGGFVAVNWLENDGDAAEQAGAAARWNTGLPAAYDIVPVRGKRAAQALTDCAEQDWVVMNVTPPHRLPCRVISPETLKKSGALALYRTGHGIRVVTARQITGVRLWNSQ